MNCENCKNNGGVVPHSSHHITCNVFGLDEFEKMILSVHVNAHRESPIIAKDLNTGKQRRAPVFNAHGIDGGWCDWPMQFDPIWIMECPFFEPKTINDAAPNT